MNDKVSKIRDLDISYIKVKDKAAEEFARSATEMVKVIKTKQGNKEEELLNAKLLDNKSENNARTY